MKILLRRKEVRRVGNNEYVRKKWIIKELILTGGKRKWHRGYLVTEGTCSKIRMKKRQFLTTQTV